MRERIEDLIKKMDEKRAELLENYIKTLENYDTQKVYEAVIPFHDIDKHISNLHHELKRVEGEEFLKRKNAAMIGTENIVAGLL